jgi:hypothetical protein
VSQQCVFTDLLLYVQNFSSLARLGCGSIQMFSTSAFAIPVAVCGSKLGAFPNAY